MKRKWPGVNKQLQILNNGLRKNYNDLVWAINKIVREAENGYHRGAFDSALEAIVRDHMGFHREDKDYGFFDKWLHGGFSGSKELIIDWEGQPSHYDNVTYATLYLEFKYHDGSSHKVVIPVCTTKDRHGDLKDVKFRIPGFSEVFMSGEELVTERYDKCIERLKKLETDLWNIINPLIRIVLGEARQKRYRIRDMINDAATKYEVKEAVYTEEDE